MQGKQYLGAEKQFKAKKKGKSLKLNLRATQHQKTPFPFINTHSNVLLQLKHQEKPSARS